MKYQLILQWSSDSIVNYDRLIDIENELIKTLKEDEVDGHDVGIQELNIFIATNHPIAAFHLVSNIFNKLNVMEEFRAAYREFGSDDFKIVWPENLTSFSIS